ncbi:hypothetical protein [Geomicrobium sp. JCM 19055]|uniref:hypothetical protein n=1 Tax=Geomicrobium sp. JCM 19055 TaxID=1460649 RepID=UPI000693BD5D|nr:hypothetical protein [Geomicrobium sp. JCM 19055]
MNELMWGNPLIQQNIRKLKEVGHVVMAPQKKEAYEIASGTLKLNYIIPPINEVVDEIEKKFRLKILKQSVVKQTTLCFVIFDFF